LNHEYSVLLLFDRVNASVGTTVVFTKRCKSISNGGNASDEVIRPDIERKNNVILQ